MIRIGGTDLARMAGLVLHGVFWGVVCGGVGGVAVGTVFLPIIGSAIGGILGLVVGACLGALCGVVLATFFGIHAWLVDAPLLGGRGFLLRRRMPPRFVSGVV